MSYSTQTAVSDGSLVLLDVSIEYFDRTEITVYFDGVPNAYPWNWVGTADNQISFSPAVPNGVTVLLRRTTDISEPRHKFSAGAAFIESILDEVLLQTLRIAQEAKEGGWGEGTSELREDLAMPSGGALVGHAPVGGGNISVSGELLSHKAELTAIHSNTGASLVGYLPAGSGAVASTVQNKLRESVSVKDFGALVDGVTDDGIAIQAAMNARALSGGGAVLVPGISISSIGLVVPSGVTLQGVGRGYNKQPLSGILFKGTGTRSQSIPGATAVTVSNPDAGAAYLADSGTRGNTYSTIDYSLPFSAAITLSPGACMRDMAVLPWFDGTSGYLGTDNRMADDWDVGIWARNSSGWSLNNVMCDGHWRKSGLLVSSSNIGDGKIPENELGQAQFCLFGGARAVSIRTPRNTPVTNYGFAGTDFINCYFRSFDHQSAHLATSSFLASPLSAPSACLEMDGPQALRGIQFITSTFVGRDDICMIFGDASEILFNGCYEESRGIKVSGAWLANTLGSRMVATSSSAAIFFHSNTKYGVDFSPYFNADSSLTGQRYTNPGTFNPETSQDSEWERPNFAASYGTRLRSNQTWRLYNSTISTVFSVTDTGGVSLSRTGVTSPIASDGNLFSGKYTPTLTNVLNVGASTAFECQYMRVGSVVTVSGQINIDPTATGDVQLGISLPVASNFSLQGQCAGTSNTDSSSASQPGVIKGDGTNDRAVLRFAALSASNTTHMFSFTYSVI